MDSSLDGSAAQSLAEKHECQDGGDAIADRDRALLLGLVAVVMAVVIVAALDPRTRVEQGDVNPSHD